MIVPSLNCRSRLVAQESIIVLIAKKEERAVIKELSFLILYVTIILTKKFIWHRTQERMRRKARVLCFGLFE